MLPPGLRKPTVVLHLIVSLGWIGAATAYVAVAVAASAGDTETVRASWTAMELIGWWVLVPMALATVVTGLILGLGSAWGLLRHYWVTISLITTVFAAVVLLLHMPDVSVKAERAQAGDAGELAALGSDLFHSVTGLALLMGVAVLNVYKPRGLTRRGWRKQVEHRKRAERMGLDARAVS
jgi:hypothetical protein